MRKTIVSTVFLWLLCCLLPGLAFAQTRTITGSVTDEGGSAVHGRSLLFNVNAAFYCGYYSLIRMIKLN